MTCPETCTRQCFYCEAALAPRHEHDHMPLPARVGGVDSVGVCLNCHDLKDRLPLNDWPVELIVRGFNECGPVGRIFLGKLLAMIADRNAEAAA